MGVANWIVLLLTHPLEFKTLLQFYLYHSQKRDIKAVKEHPTSGWDRQSMKRCWNFLDLTSRSFSAVIKELDGDLARTASPSVSLVISYGPYVIFDRFVSSTLCCEGSIQSRTT